MKKSNFLKKLGLCVLSAALCVSAFAACDNSKDNSGDSGSGASEEPQVQELTSAEFFAELKTRETASIAAKKWAKADLFINAVIDGETKTWNVVGGEIVHKANGRSAIKFEKDSLDVFGYSTYQGEITLLVSEKYEKIGDILKCVWIASDGAEKETAKCTFDADGYVTEYTYEFEFSDGDTNAFQATFSNYAGEGEFPSESESGDQGGTIIIPEQPTE